MKRPWRGLLACLWFWGVAHASAVLWTAVSWRAVGEVAGSNGAWVARVLPAGRTTLGFGRVWFSVPWSNPAGQPWLDAYTGHWIPGEHVAGTLVSLFTPGTCGPYPFPEADWAVLRLLVAHALIAVGVSLLPYLLRRRPDARERRGLSDVLRTPWVCVLWPAVAKLTLGFWAGYLSGSHRLDNTHGDAVALGPCGIGGLYAFVLWTHAHCVWRFRRRGDPSEAVAVGGDVRGLLWRLAPWLLSAFLLAWPWVLAVLARVLPDDLASRYVPN